jgi:hypothetical protein
MSEDDKKRKCGLAPNLEHGHDHCPVAKSIAQALIGERELVSNSTSSGPAKVNLEAYRTNFETIFGAKQKVWTS